MPEAGEDRRELVVPMDERSYKIGRKGGDWPQEKTTASAIPNIGFHRRSICRFPRAITALDIASIHTLFAPPILNLPLGIIYLPHCGADMVTAICEWPPTGCGFH